MCIYITILTYNFSFHTYLQMTDTCLCKHTIIIHLQHNDSSSLQGQASFISLATFLIYSAKHNFSFSSSSFHSKHVFPDTLGSFKHSLKLLSQVNYCLSLMWLADLHGSLTQMAWIKKKFFCLLFFPVLQAVAEISSFPALSLFLFVCFFSVKLLSLIFPLIILLNFAVNETKNPKRGPQFSWYHLATAKGLLKFSGNIWWPRGGC